jgi:hypothetical protein
MRVKIAGALAVLLLAAALWWVFSPPAPVIDAVYPSPDAAYRVVVYRIPQRVAMPGQGSDARGTLQLVDRDGKVLQETPVALLREVRPPEWQSKSVRIPMIAEWPLP